MKIKKQIPMITPKGELKKTILNFPTLKNGKPIKNLRQDAQFKYYVALDAIARKVYYSKVKNSKFRKFKWQPLSHNKMRKLCGSNWGFIKKDLIAMGIIECDSKWSSNGKMNRTGKAFPASYRFKEKWLNSHSWEVLNVDVSSLSLNHRKELVDKTNKKDLNSKYQYSKFMERFTIDKVEANKVFSSIAKKRKWKCLQQCYWQLKIATFNDDNYISNSTKTGREYNKVNAMPKELRSFIYFDGEETVELDIKSAAPTILTKYITDQKERFEWAKLIKDEAFYETLAIRMGSIRKRDLAKEKFTHFLGGSKKVSIVHDWLKFRFPIFYAEIERIIANDFRLNGKGTLSRLTQKEEATVILGKLAQFGASIHDCLLVKEKEHEFIFALMVEECSKQFETETVITVENKIA